MTGTVYPVVGDNPPWLNPKELGIPVVLDGVQIIAVPSQDAVTGDIDLGAIGFEADNPYVLVSNPDIAAMGDLHGKTVVIGLVNYLVRNVREKPNQAYTRLILEKR